MAARALALLAALVVAGCASPADDAAPSAVAAADATPLLRAAGERLLAPVSADTTVDGAEGRAEARGFVHLANRSWLVDVTLGGERSTHLGVPGTQVVLARGHAMLLHGEAAEDPAGVWVVAGLARNGTVRAATAGPAGLEVEVEGVDARARTQRLTLTLATEPPTVTRAAGAWADEPNATWSLAVAPSGGVPEPPTKAARALLLDYRAEPLPAPTPGLPAGELWTFTRGGLPLGEVEAHVQREEAGKEPEDRTTLWHLRLDRRAGAGEGGALVFTDRDGDGQVSAGDTLEVRESDPSATVVVLRDVQTGLFVYAPAGGLVGALVALAAAASVRGGPGPASPRRSSSPGTTADPTRCRP